MMIDAVDHILDRMLTNIMLAKAQRGAFRANSISGRVAVAEACADTIENIAEAAALAIIEVGKECESLTGMGSTGGSEVLLETYKSDAVEHLTFSIRECAKSALAEIRTTDPNREHRLTASELGLRSTRAM